MSTFIKIKLRGPMMSFGGDAVSHKWRGTESFPTISFVLGFLCSCLGISFRREVGKAKALLEAVKVHIVVLKEARRITDFQTSGTQYNKEDKYEKLCIVLKPGGSGTSDIYHKEYLTDGKFDVVLEVIDKDMAGNIIDALKRPVWTPFLGRKSNLLSELPYDGSFSTWDEVKQHYQDLRKDSSFSGSVRIIKQVPANYRGCFPVCDYPVCRGDNKTRTRFACEEQL